MNDEKPNILIRILLFFVDIIYAIFNRFAGLLVNIILIYGLCYFGFTYYLDSNPDKKAIFEEKKAVLAGMLSQTGTLLEAQQNGELPEGNSLENISHLITPEMMQMAVNIMGASKEEEGQAPPQMDLSALPTIDENAIPKQLQPVDDIFQHAKNYQKIRPQFTIANAGTDGAKSVPTLDKLLGNKNPIIAEAAYISLRLIGNQDAINVLKKHGYGK